MFETAEAREEAERFREQARRDPLTGLHNRRYVDERLPGLIADAAAAGTPLTLAVLDLDHFKHVNDTLSHETGDRVLVAVAGLLEAGVPAPGFAARMGGEEFLVVLPGLDLATAVPVLDRMRAAVGGHPWQPVTGGHRVT